MNNRLGTGQPVRPVAGHTPHGGPAAAHERRGTKDTDRRGNNPQPNFVYDWDHKQELGRGNFGVVYKVVKDDMSPLARGRVTVAIKCVDKSQNGAGVRSTELKALSVLATAKNKNIVRYFGKFEYKIGRTNYDCFEFEYIDGGDLFHYMWSFFQGGYNIPTSTIAYFTRQILIGLDFIHGKGFAHRDIKPENLMLTKDYTVKITDFGLALEMPTGYAYSGSVAGTMLYLAPEQFADNIQGYAADIWAVGVTVFNLYFKGNFPFELTNKFTIRKKAMALYATLVNERKYDELRSKEKSMIRTHYQEPNWPSGIDEWYQSHQDAYDFIERLLRVSYTRRPSARRALDDPWIKTFEPEGQQPEQAKPFSPADAAKNKKVTGLAKLQAAIKPKRNAGRKSRISKFLDKITK